MPYKHHASAYRLRAAELMGQISAAKEHKKSEVLVAEDLLRAQSIGVSC